MSLVHVSNISSGYGNRKVIEDISFEIKKGELVGILGANGSGKSTLVKAICNLLKFTGQVEIDGKYPKNLKQSELASLISYVPQNSGIGIEISVFDIVMMGFNPKLRLLENPNKTMKDKAGKVIELVGLSGLEDTSYMTLSEGQKRLVILARALVSDGMLMIMDEPEGALDFSVRSKVMRLIRNWIGEEKAGLIILHDTGLALNNCDRLLILKEGHLEDIIDVHKDSIETMEQKLRLIYGNISLAKVKNSSGKVQIVMVSN